MRSTRRPRAHACASVSASHRLTVESRHWWDAKRRCRICAGSRWPMRTRSLGSTASHAALGRAAHTPASIQALRSGALEPLPLPAL
eukprot:5665664-Pleurochrysis_carterae.AAC.1